MKIKFHKIKTTDFPHKISFWILNQKWLWIKSKIEFVSYCSQDIDRRVENVIGYRHFIFKGCIACETHTQDKEYLIKNWFIRHNKFLNKQNNVKTN